MNIRTLGDGEFSFRKVCPRKKPSVTTVLLHLLFTLQSSRILTHRSNMQAMHKISTHIMRLQNRILRKRYTIYQNNSLIIQNDQNNYKIYNKHSTTAIFQIKIFTNSSPLNSLPQWHPTQPLCFPSPLSPPQLVISLVLYQLQDHMLSHALATAQTNLKI